jgi:hypothetical protein
MVATAMVSKLWDGNVDGGFDETAAFISDRYFIFEEFDVPPLLNKSEISSMARITIERMFPGDYGVLFGFFVDKSKARATAFAASKERLFSEIPQLKTCTYWLPERFVRSNVCNEQIKKIDSESTMVAVDNDGFFTLNDHRFKLFSDGFWTAEMHDEEEKKLARKIISINNFCKKSIFPLWMFSSLLVLVMVGLLAFNFSLKFKEKTLASEKPRIDRIVKRNGVYKEMLSFRSKPSACLELLREINSARPSTMKFVEYSISGSKDVRLIGSCNSVETLNAFIENLKKSGAVSSAKTISAFSSQKKTTFTLEVEFL